MSEAATGRARVLGDAHPHTEKVTSHSRGVYGCVDATHGTMAPHEDVPPSRINVQYEDVEELVGMGFERSSILTALEAANGDKQLAINMLLG